MTLEEVISKWKKEIAMMKDIVVDKDVSLDMRLKYEHKMIAISPIIQDLEKIECNDFEGENKLVCKWKGDSHNCVAPIGNNCKGCFWFTAK